MRTSTWIAIGLTAAVAAWLASGLVIPGEDEEQADSAARPQPTLVEVRPSAAETVPQYIYAQGVAQPYRTADVIAPTGGTLAEIEVSQGDEVKAEAVLAQVRLEARRSQLESAQAQVRRLEADLAGLRQLRQEGFATEARVRELESQLENARATLESVRADIRDTTIEAPIPGIVSDVFINSGETATAGTSILRIVDNAPLRVTIQISQRDVGSIDVGRGAIVSFATGALAKGRVCFVAPAADPQTRTFRVEVRVPNEDRSIPSVVSTEVRVQRGEAEAHFISPAILTLGEAGELGIKSVDAEDVVQFHPVEIVRAGTDGIWVAGLPEEVRLITTGQGFVRDGERVRVRQVEDDDGSTDGTENTPLPTSIVEEDETAFSAAQDIPEPPPAEELCRGTAANAVMTSSVPGGPSGASGATTGTGGTETQPGGASVGVQAAPQNQSGAATGAGTTAGAGAGTSGAGSAPAGSSTGPVSPEIPAPPVVQPPPQVPGGGQQQGGGGAGAGAGDAAGAGSSDASSAPGGGQGGGSP